MRIRAIRYSAEHRAGCEPQLPSAAGAEQSTGHLHADAAEPWRAPRGDATMTCLHPAAEQVEGEHLEQERRLVGVEAVGGDLADPEAALQLTDDGLYPGAV